MRNLLAFAVVVLACIFCMGIIAQISTEPPVFFMIQNEFAEPIRIRIPQNIPPTPEPVTMPPQGWYGVFCVPTLFSSEQLAEMISYAPHYSHTRTSVQHPNRVMNDDERNFWETEYNALGGINAQELEMYKIVNEIRAGYELPPFVLCPRLSMASRLFSYLQVREHSTGHIDPYYNDLMARSNFFGVFGSLYMENANSQKWQVFPNGVIEYIYLSPQGLVDGWMDSEDHRAHILTTETTHAGFGVDSGNNRVVPTMKTIMPRH